MVYQYRVTVNGIERNCSRHEFRTNVIVETMKDILTLNPKIEEFNISIKKIPKHQAGPALKY